MIDQFLPYSSIVNTRHDGSSSRKLYPSNRSNYYLKEYRTPEIILWNRDPSFGKRRKKKNFHFLERKWGKVVASRNSWTLRKRKRCTTQTFRAANKRDEQQEEEGRRGRKGASVKGKKFEHFARFEARFERKVFTSDGASAYHPIVASNNKGQSDPGWPVSLSPV